MELPKLPIPKDKLWHLMAGTGLFMPLLFLGAFIDPVFFVVAGVSLAFPFVWELITRRKIDSDGWLDIKWTFVGYFAGLSAFLMWFFFGP